MAAKNKMTKRTSRRATTFVTAQATTIAPTREDIARRAFELYLDRGGEHGQDADDWLRAERELRERIAS